MASAVQMREAEQRQEVAVVRQDIDRMTTEFARTLPKHIPPERFARVLITAVQMNPKLLTECDRTSLFAAAMKAAQDGLLPDGREGALVPFKGKVQWMPMVAGIRKKVRNSGEIATWDAHVVYEADAFEFELGDDPFIKHKPALIENRGNVIAAYSVATLKTGEKSREVMSIGEILKVRDVSRAKDSADGPWKNWFEEMCRKTVARRHSKVLPMSTDMDDLLRRDDELYNFKARSEEAQAPKLTMADKLKALAGGEGAPKAAPEAAKGDEVAHDAETGEVKTEQAEAPREDAQEGRQDPQGQASPSAATEAAPKDESQAPTQAQPAQAPKQDLAPPLTEEVAFEKGQKARREGFARAAVPQQYADGKHEGERIAFLRGWDKG